MFRRTNCSIRRFSSCRGFQQQLRIAFFGTDEFTNQSLIALNNYMHSDPTNQISQLDLITRRPKPSGRGRKLLKEPASMKCAKEEGINVIMAETPEEINALGLSGAYNMAIAVSYGKLIPGEFLAHLKYGGLNVHPSLLPSLRGAAPVQHALLQGHQHTGVSIQSLHPTKFDKGRIIYQSDKVPIRSDHTLKSLLTQLGDLGAESLVHVIHNKMYKQLQEQEQDSSSSRRNSGSYAPKLALQDKEINIELDGVHQVLLVYRVFDQVHSFHKSYIGKTKAERKQKIVQTKRLILGELFDVTGDYPELLSSLGTGEYTIRDNICIIRLKDGLISAGSLLLEGFAATTPEKFQKAAKHRGLFDMQLVSKDGG